MSCHPGLFARYFGLFRLSFYQMKLVGDSRIFKSGMRRWLLRIGIVILLFLGSTLSACASSNNSPTPQAPDHSPTATPSGSTGNPAATPSAGPLILYHRSGGIAGLDETFQVYADGLITSGDHKNWRVTPADVQRLMDQINQSGFYQVNQAGPFVVPCCDRLTYSLTVNLNGKTHLAQIFDGATDQPAAIQKAIDAVEQFIVKNRMRQE
jgi:hypothetical protein